jgi:hypothetical protein
MPRYWALQVNPKNYRIAEAVRDHSIGQWLTGRSGISAGDRVAIWKTLGDASGKRGIIALGEVLSDPENVSDSENPYWLNHEMASVASPRVLVRYRTAPNLPLWVGGPADILLQSLAVARAQGGTAFKITESQWQQLIDAAGGWPDAAPDPQLLSIEPPSRVAAAAAERVERLAPGSAPTLIEAQSSSGSSTRRRALIDQVAHLAGDGIARVIDARDGWPGMMQVGLSSGIVTLAVHVGEVGLSHRGRDAVERRFQNPAKGRPISTPAGTLPVLLGVWAGRQRPLLVGMDADVRMSRQTRQSLFIPLSLLEQAEMSGWAERVSGSGELLIAFHPALLPVYVEARRAKVSLPILEMGEIAQAAGLTPSEDASPAERARRLARALVRKGSFSRRVLEAYEGLCAMCDLDLGLVEGAHIYPAQAPASPDEVWNALALCCNHHSAFDHHQVWIEPTSLRIAVHPAILGQAGRNQACRSFVETIRTQLRGPRNAEMAPRGEMLTRRYEYFGDLYRWAT